MNETMLIFEKSNGCKAYSLPRCDVPIFLPKTGARLEIAALPEVSELDLLRHYIGLSSKNHGVLSGLYSLGSCTMKYNPAINEKVAAMTGFCASHPKCEDIYSQGNMEMMYDLSNMLAEITGMDEVSLQPAAGAHGELAGLMIMKAYHDSRGESNRVKMLIPDTAHGTNPASAAMAGFDVVEVKSDENGNVDIADLITKIDGDLGGLMLTNPSTIGLFETNILEIAEIIHDAGGLLYYDGANMNAIMGVTRPGDMGFDIIHLNLHKTFSTPHGGGGPGSGPVGVKERLAKFLPSPIVVKDNEKFKFEIPKESIGKVRSFYGNFGVFLRAYAYILTMGESLRQASEVAVLNANYLMSKLKPFMKIAYDRVCMHEFVVTGAPQKEKGVSTLDMAKRLLDYSVHPPTIYFPLIVKEAMMFEPTETESKRTLDAFAEILESIIKEVEEHPENLKEAPLTTTVGRLDDTKAARNPVLVWREND